MFPLDFPPAVPPSSATQPLFPDQLSINANPADPPPTLVMPANSVPAAAAATTTVDPSSVPALSFDVEDMTTADLLNNINPDLFDYVKCNTPHVYSGLVAQERTNGTSNAEPPAPTFHSIDSIMPIPSPTPDIDYSQTPSQSNTQSLRLPKPARIQTPVPPVSVTPFGTNPTNSLTVPLLNPNFPVQPAAPPMTMPCTIPPHLTNPALVAQNPALMAVLRQAQAMVSLPHFQQQTATRPSFPLGPPHFNSPSQTPNNAKIAAVAGAAAAAAAAAANNTVSPTIPRRLAPSLENTYHPHHTHARPRVLGTRIQERIPSAQAVCSPKPSQPPSKSHAITSSPTQRQPSQPLRSTVSGHKRTNSAIKQTAASSSTVLHSSLSRKRPSSVSSTTSQSLESASTPASRGRLHPAGDALAGVGAGVNGSASSAASNGMSGVSPGMGGPGTMTAQPTAVSGQPSDLEEDGDVEVKKAMRAERNRQSAAASRERKKHYIKELERRVNVLSRENAEMQVTQLRMLRERLDHESEILDQMKELKRKVVDRDMEIHKLSRELHNAKLRGGDLDGEDGVLNVPRPKTWDEAEWKKKKRGSRRRV